MEAVKFKTVSFKAGAYVYVEEQADSSEFYIIRQGILVEESPVNTLTDEEDLILKAGDFFGVLDCMSQRMRLSSVRVMQDAVLIVVRFDQFESLITQMAPAAMKIIRYFSHQLRKYNTTLSHLTVKNINENASLTGGNTLFSLGEYYKHHGLNSLAGYAYSRFIEMHPDDPDVEKAKQSIDLLKYDPSSTLPVLHGVQQTYEAGQPIFLETEEGHDFYIILEGFIKVTKFIDNTEILLAVLKEKDIIGEMAILENSPRSASAVASTKVTVLRINRQNFELYVKTHPEIARRIIQLLSDRIWVIYKRLANLSISEPTARIYDALNTLLQKNRVPLQKGLSYAFEMSPSDLVQYVGLEPSLGNMIIEQILRNDPVLFIDRNQIISRDVCSIRSSLNISNRSKSRN